MSMKRTNVYADPEDLAIITEAAKRRGMSEAEIIRQGIHLAAMANRVWDEPLFSRTFEGPGRTPSMSEVRDTVAEAGRWTRLIRNMRRRTRQSWRRAC
ncbi:CopG family transcriptional regulator [Streptomyces sp. NPDC001228]|uniref:ribbon-helix-helix domain-containing protein n=1 Tax=Streptomyces sp. NPDC001228 TaxID=3154381 RepID=UPI00331F1A88